VLFFLCVKEIVVKTQCISNSTVCVSLNQNLVHARAASRVFVEVEIARVNRLIHDLIFTIEKR
jgi:hypothetical protein